MLVQQQQMRSQQIKDTQQYPGQSTKFNSKSNKIPTHFTIPEQNQCKKQNIRSKPLLSKSKNSSKIQDKQYRKLNRQCKKVRSLEQEYRQMQQEIREIKQMVQLQLELINHTNSLTGSNSSSNSSDMIIEDNLVQKVQQLQRQPQCMDQNNNKSTQKVQSVRLQQLISELFSYQQTIQTANSNYLLLSQVNKQQQSQSMFQINTLQQRIRQLRFLLNGKQDLLAYQLATIDNVGEQQDEGQQMMKPIVIDYHMPKKIIMVNRYTVESQYSVVERAVGEMGRLREEVREMEEELRELENKDSNGNSNGNVKENEEQQQIQDVQCQLQDVNSINRNNIKYSIKQSIRQSRGKNTNSNPSQTTRASSQSAISKTNLQLKSNINNNNKNINSIQQQQLDFLPLSTTNYKSSLIYKVSKLNQLQVCKSQQLKQQYKELMSEYKQQVTNKKTLVQQYQLKRDIYQYKKKQSMNMNVNNKNHHENILGQIYQQQEQDKQCYEQHLVVNVHNILDGIHQHQQSNVINRNVILVKSSSYSTTESQSKQSNYCIVDSNNNNKSNKENTLQHTPIIFNQITNTPQKKQQQKQQQHQHKNPFLKLKLKSTIKKQSNTQKLSSFTPSRFSQQKHQHNDKENPSNHHKQDKPIILNTPKDNTYNTPTKKRRFPAAKKTISRHTENIQIQNI